ncbi:MAG: MFS transporter [Oscillospiraceae bacterium]|jgi:GPH family glycoside/pentoside/hexuronide:cation symporter|nr:MFS transporter [Oscillospiraceae bacterium]
MDETRPADLTQETKFVSGKEQLAFYASAFFRDMSYAVMGMVNYFYTDILGLQKFKLGLLLWAEKLWDGVNDPLVGAYFDKRAYQTEKARVFFKTTALPVALLLIVMFLPIRFSANENVNTWLRMALVLLCYIPFEAMHTLNGTAYMSYYNSITPNIQERGEIISRARLFSSIGSAVAGSGGLISILMSFVPKDDIQAKTWVYLGVAVFVAVCFLLYNRLMYTQVRERIVSPPQEQQNVRGIFRGMLQNKLFLIMMISNALAGLISPGNTGMYFYDYNVGNTIWQTVIGLAGFPALLLASAVTPMLIKRFEKRNLILACGVLTILTNLIYLAVGYQSKLFMALITFLTNIPGAIKSMLYWSMIADSVDYLEWRTGKRNDGAIYAVEGLMGKIVGAFGSTSTAIIISVIHFTPNQPSQPPETLRGLFVLPLVITILSTAISTLPYFFYDLKRKDHARIIEELKMRSETAAE